MLHYPKMPDATGCPGGPCIAFEKYDGTNLHWDWDRDFGWHAFGTRRDAFNLTDAGIGQFEQAHSNLIGAPALFEATLAEPLDRVLRRGSCLGDTPEVKAFTEFLGERSFAGMHVEGDRKCLILFDVELVGVGMLSPFDFVRVFAELPIARVVYQGRYTGQLAEDVRRGRFEVAEGVVVKGVADGGPWRVKIKTLAYQERLKRSFAERWGDHWE
jgi:RNA ligase